MPSVHIFSSPLNRHSALLSCNVWKVNNPGPDRRYGVKASMDQNQGKKLKDNCKSAENFLGVETEVRHVS